MSTPPPSSASPGPLTRFRERLRSTPAWVRWAVASGIGLALMGGVVGTVMMGNRLQQRQRSLEAAGLWAKFDRAANVGDEAEMLATLESISALTTDPLCDRYRNAITSGEAPPDDPRLCRLTTNLHTRGRRWDAAAREARKQLAHEPDDWNARCLVTLAALKDGDLATARSELDRLPDPSVVAPTPGGLLLAFDLYRRTGRGTTPLRDFVNDVVVDVLNSPAVLNDPPSVKVELVDCYLLGFTAPADEPVPPRLGRAMAAVLRLTDAAEQSDDPVVLTRLGSACQRLSTAMDRLQRAGQMTTEQREGLGEEHEARTARVWQRVKELAPATAAAYSGLARAEMRANRPEAALSEVREGLTRCGNDPGLLAWYALLLRATDRTDEALRALAAAADADPKNLDLLLLVTETALATNRRDVAAVAVGQASAIAPTDPRVIRQEVLLKLQGGNTHSALQRLRDLGEPAILAEPVLVRVYTLCLFDAGLRVLLPDWLEAVGGRNDPATAAAAARGLTDTRFDAEVDPLALRLLDRTLTRWPGDADTLAARSLLLARWAEYGKPRWEPARTREAVFATERVRAIDPDAPDVAALLARLRLKGLNDPSRAMKDIAPLLGLRDRGGLLTADQLGVVGMVELANGKAEAAVSTLESANKLGPPTAAVCLHLALAYHTLGETSRGRSLVITARRLPRTPQDDADLAALPATLRESP